MKVVDAGGLEWQEYRHPREGLVEVKPLAAGEAVPGVNFFFLMVRYGRGAQPFETPRHRHTFEQIRMPVQGSLNFDRGKDIPEGWVGYFPAGASYGPQRVESGTVVGVQFGAGYLSEEQKRRAQEELAGRGEFHDGFFHSTDPTTGKPTLVDGMEAMWEHTHGTKLTYPEPQYPSPILMDPEAFAWERTATGTHRRFLGAFTDRDVRISLVRWDRDVAIDLSDDRSQLLFVLEGEGDADDVALPSEAALWSELGDGTRVSASPGTSALLVDLPLRS